MGEIDLRREKRGRGNTLIALARHVRERHCQKCPANTITDRIHLALAGGLFDNVECGERALAHVILEAPLGEPCVRVDPGDDEDGEALIHTPFDEGFFRRQIENVELIDPRRHDQQRSLEHAFSGRRVLNELH